MPLTDRPPTGKAWACTEGQRRIPATRPSGGAATRPWRQRAKHAREATERRRAGPGAPSPGCGAEPPARGDSPGGPGSRAGACPPTGSWRLKSARRPPQPRPGEAGGAPDTAAAEGQDSATSAEGAEARGGPRSRSAPGCTGTGAPQPGTPQPGVVSRQLWVVSPSQVRVFPAEAWQVLCMKPEAAAAAAVTDGSRPGLALLGARPVNPLWRGAALAGTGNTGPAVPAAPLLPAVRQRRSRHLWKNRYFY